jgi:hypothetical protein
LSTSKAFSIWQGPIPRERSTDCSGGGFPAASLELSDVSSAVITALCNPRDMTLRANGGLTPKNGQKFVF